MSLGFFMGINTTSVDGRPLRDRGSSHAHSTSFRLKLNAVLAKASSRESCLSSATASSHDGRDAQPPPTCSATERVRVAKHIHLVRHRPTRITRLPRSERLTPGWRLRPDVYLNELGAPMRVELPRLLPSTSAPLTDFGCSVGVRLLMGEGRKPGYFLQAAAVFLLMFCLSVSALVDNADRANLHFRCRMATTNATSYAILTTGSATWLADAPPDGNATVANLEAFLLVPPDNCGYVDQPIRRFNRTNLLEVYQPANSFFLLRTALGGCQEYSNATSEMLPRPGADAVVHQIHDAAWCLPYACPKLRLRGGLLGTP